MTSANTGSTGSPRSTIGIKQSTKNRLDVYRYPGQSYDGFLRQLLDMWEKTEDRGLYRTSG